MKSAAIPKALTARFNETDRRLAAAAIQSHVFERKALSAAPVPLGYRARINRSRYAAELRRHERDMRSAARTLDRYQVGFTPRFRTTPLSTAHARRGLVPPTAVRIRSARSDFHLVRIDGRIGMPSEPPVRAMRLELGFDPHLKSRARRAVAYSLFPKGGGRLYRGTDVYFGVMPNLTFWVPKKEGVTFARAGEIGPAVRRAMLVGPLRASYRRLAITGTGAGGNRIEFQFMSTTPGIRSAPFSVWIVLQVPRGRKTFRVNAEFEVDTRVSRALRAQLGRHRILRDSAHWNVALPKVDSTSVMRTD